MNNSIKFKKGDLMMMSNKKLYIVLKNDKINQKIKVFIDNSIEYEWMYYSCETDKQISRF